MNRLLAIGLFLLLISCGSQKKTKIPCYAWLGGPGKASNSELKAEFTEDVALHGDPKDIRCVGRGGRFDFSHGKSF